MLGLSTAGAMFAFCSITPPPPPQGLKSARPGNPRAPSLAVVSWILPNRVVPWPCGVRELRDGGRVRARACAVGGKRGVPPPRGDPESRRLGGGVRRLVARHATLAARERPSGAIAA